MPPPTPSRQTRCLPDPAAPTPSQAHWCSSNSGGRSPQTSAPSIQHQQQTFREPCLLLLHHSSLPLLQWQPLQLHPPPSSTGPRPCLDHHQVLIPHQLLCSLSPLNHLLPLLCPWLCPPQFHLPLHLVASRLPQQGNQLSSGSLLTMIWIFHLQPKHNRTLSSLPVQYCPKVRLRLQALCLTQSPRGCPPPQQHSLRSPLPSQIELQPVTKGSKRDPVTTACSQRSRQKDRITLHI